MKLFIIALCMLAGALGSNDHGNNACLDAVIACYPDKTRNAVQDYIAQDTPDFTNACQLYGTTIDCINKVKRTKGDLCVAVDHHIKNLTNYMDYDVRGMCNEDGTENSCSLKSSECVAAISDSMGNFENNKNNLGCVYGNIGALCVKQLKMNHLCVKNPQKVKQLEDDIAKVQNKQISTNCNASACAQGVDKCFTQLAQDVTSVPYPSETCKDFKATLDCTNGLTQCKGDQYLQLTLTTYEMSDYCDKTGQWSQCKKDVDACKTNYDADKVRKMPNDQQCSKMKDYLNCNSKVSCSDKYKKQQMSSEKSTITQQMKELGCNGASTTIVSLFAIIMAALLHFVRS